MVNLVQPNEWMETNAAKNISSPHLKHFIF